MTKPRILYLITTFMLGLTIVSAQGGVWTWMNGSGVVDGPGNYGVKGVSSSENEPPPRYQATHWKDKDGNFWMFGGHKSGNYSDLWRYNPSINEWTWMHGPNTTNTPGIFGEKGVPSPLNSPPAAYFGASGWYDGDDGLYMYGGFSDWKNTNMWKYSISTNEWVWLTGSEFEEDQRVFGEKGISSPDNTPGQQVEAEQSWVYDEKLWKVATPGINFLLHGATWHFDLNTLEWTWVHGPLGGDYEGEQGTLGVFDETNYPGQTDLKTRWGNEENCYILGRSFNHNLWHFNADSVAWRRLKQVEDSPFWEDFCDDNEATFPNLGVEYQTTAVFQDFKEVLWLLGGSYNSSLWAYVLDQGNWFLVWGTPDGPPPSEVLGIKGEPSVDNTPMDTEGACMWSDDEGNLWLWGGFSTSAMWRFDPDYSCLNLSDSCELTVTFRISNTQDSSGSVEIQVVDGEGVIEYSIDGGMNWSTNNFFEDLSPGDYDVVIRDENGCTYYGTISILDINVGLENITGWEILFSPNPTRDILQIEINHNLLSNNSEAYIRLIDGQGRSCLQATAMVENNSLKGKISMRDLAAGNYFLRIVIDEVYILERVTKI